MKVKRYNKDNRINIDFDDLKSLYDIIHDINGDFGQDEERVKKFKLVANYQNLNDMVERLINKK